MRTVIMERQTVKGEKIKLSLELDINRKIDDYKELEITLKIVKDMYDNAISTLFTQDSTEIVSQFVEKL